MRRSRHLLSCLWLAILTGWFFCFFCQGLTISEERRKYLKAETLAKTGFEPANLKAILNILLRDVIRDDPDLAHELVFHTDNLIRQDQERNRESFFNEEPPVPGKSHIAEFIDFFELNNESLAAIGVMVRTYRNDYKSQLQYSGQRSESRAYALFSHFLNLGGNYDVPQAMDLLQRDLRIACGEGNSLFLAPYFHELAYCLRPAQRLRVAAWAAARRGDPGVTASTTAQAILLGLALFQRAENADLGEPKVPRGESFDEALLGVIQDASLSVSWRLGFAALLCGQGRDLAPLLRLEAANLLSAALESKLPVQAETRVNILNAFLGGQGDEGGWQTAASRLIAAAEAAGDLASSELIRSPSIELHWIAQRLDLLCRAGRPEAVRAYLYPYSLNTQLYPSLWLTLVANRKFELASQLFQTHAQTTPFSAPRFLPEHYNRRLDQALPDYLPTIRDPGDQALAELLAIATPDPETKHPPGKAFGVPPLGGSSALDRSSAPPKGGTPNSDRQGRFRRFSGKFGASPPRWNREQQLRAAEVFSLSEGVPWMSEWLRNREIGIVARIQQPEPKIDPYWAGRIEMHHAAERLEAGQPLPLLMMWGRAVEEDDRILETRRRYVTDALISLVDARLESALRQRDGERARKMLYFSRQLIATYPEKIPNQVNSRLLLQFSVKALLAHAVFGEIDAWNKSWAALDPARSSHLVSLLKRSGDLVPVVIGLLNPDREAAGGNRHPVFSGLFQTDWVNQGLPACSVLAGLTAGKLIEESDLLPLAEGLARRAPREGSSWREYLGVLAERGGPREALGAADREIARQDLEQGLRNALLVEKLLILRSLKLDPEVRELEKALSARELKLPREYQAAVNGLKLR